MKTLLLECGRIYGHPGADSILVGNGRILAIGDHIELRGGRSGSCCHKVALDGRLVIPGFIDAHTHFLQTGRVASGQQISLVGLTRDGVLEAIRAAGERRSEGEWVLAGGWDESQWNPRRPLAQQELDRAAPHHPVAAVRIDGHVMVLNGLGMSRFPPGIEHSLDGHEPGVVREEAVFAFGRAITRSSTVEEQDRAFDAAVELARPLGITSVHVMTTQEEVAVYRRGCERRRIRVNLCPERPALETLISEGVRTGAGDEWLRYGGVKLFADGSIGAANAAVSEPFINGTCGRLNHSDEEIRGFIGACDEAGLQTVIHAIGDRAIEQVLAAHEALGSSRYLRHRIEHYELPTGEHVERTKEIGAWLCVQPNFIGQWSGPGSLYVARLGEARDRRSNPLRAILVAGIGLGFGSDGMPMSPLYGIRSTLQAPYREQRLSFEEAVDAYTRGGAALSHEERVKGTLAVGMFADLVVLSATETATAESMDDLEVDATFLNGELVYER
ncbi:amidohydrolase [Candidatus Bipolaricaulota bacterium]|nr:amidohydrolase [Candidatus Bipolaricaulota bacterium]